MSLSNLPARRPTVQPPVTGRPASLSEVVVARQTRAALTRLEAATTVRRAGAYAEAAVQTEKVKNLADATREAMTDATLLHRHREVLAAGDPLLYDDLKYLSDTYRIGAAEILSDLVSSYCRESRGR